MAFTQKNKRDHIAEIQRYLYDISLHDANIPTIIPDGIYGEETRESVRTFQNKHGLVPDGEVNPKTWSAITDNHIYYTTQPLPLDIFPQNYLLMPGTENELVYIVQVLMNLISKEYDNLPFVEVNGIYTPQMHDTVNMLKKISGTDTDKDGISTATWNVLASF